MGRVPPSMPVRKHVPDGFVGRVLAGTVAGVGAFVVGYVLTYGLLWRDRPETWEHDPVEFTGVVFSNAQFASHEANYPEEGFGGDAVNVLLDGSHVLSLPTVGYFLVPFVTVTLAGAILASVLRDRTTSPGGAARLGAFVVVGYVPLVALGTQYFAVSPEFELISPGVFEPNVLDALVVAGIVYPAVCGAIGGLLVASIARERSVSPDRLREKASSSTFRTPAIAGAIAVIAGTVATYALLWLQARGRIGDHVVFGYFENNPIDSTGLVFFNSHFVDHYANYHEGTPTMFGPPSSNFVRDGWPADGVPLTDLHLLVPVVTLVCAGAILAWQRQSAMDAPLQSAKAGAHVVAGYCPLVVVGAVALRHDHAYTIGPYLGEAVLYAGVAYPLVFGGVGGLLVFAIRSTNRYLEASIPFAAGD